MGMIYLLSNQNHKDVINLSVIETFPLEYKVDFSQFQALVFTSKNSIKAILKDIQIWRKIPCFCIGKQTAKELRNTGISPFFIGDDLVGDEFARLILPNLQHKKVLYLKAKKVHSNLTEILRNNGILLDELVVYETKCKAQNQQVLCENAILIFTSPSCVDCFLEQYDWKDSFKAVCIGKVTRDYLLAKNIQKEQIYISKEHSIQACISLAKGFL